MNNSKWHSLLVTFVLIVTLTFITTHPIHAAEDVAPGFEGTEQLESPSAENFSDDTENDIPDIAPFAEDLFDNSDSFIPLEFLPVVETNIKDEYIEADAEDATRINEEKITEDLETISITPSGQIVTIPADDYDVETFKAELMKIIDASEMDEFEDENNMSEEDITNEEMEPDWQAKSVIPPRDSRRRINNTGAFPFRTAGRIDIGCTGTLSGKHHVLTAGHCVYNIRSNRWYSNLNFNPGQNGVRRPYGRIGWKRVLSVRGWTRSHRRDYDYAMIILNRDIGNRVGWMPFGWHSRMPKYFVNINGYPSDKRPLNTMWQSPGRLRRVSVFRLFHDCDTFGGNSGSGIYVFRANRRIIYGVHTYSIGASPSSWILNSGTRITRQRFNNLLNWRARF